MFLFELFVGITDVMAEFHGAINKKVRKVQSGMAGNSLEYENMRRKTNRNRI